MQDIADLLGCSLHKVKYWMSQHGIKTRSVSDAIYLWHNPDGDPFKFHKPKSYQDHELFGLGLGLYWGEGTKSDKYTIRLGNTDPKLIGAFIAFLIKIFGIQTSKLRFGLQIFSDINEDEALDFWLKNLKVNKSQFFKTVVTKSGSIGTYKNKSKFGVLTVNFSNKKARDLLVSMLPM